MTADQLAEALLAETAGCCPWATDQPCPHDPKD